MKFVSLLPPGRFPTVVSDPGLWWSSLAASSQNNIQRIGTNFDWWKIICSPVVYEVLLSPLKGMQRWKQRMEWRADNISLKESARLAGYALEDLCTPSPYKKASAYITTVTQLAEYLLILNQVQKELHFSFDSGARVLGLDYTDSSTLVKYAKQDTLLSRFVSLALQECPRNIQFLALNITCPEDLLTAMIAARILRQEIPDIYVCLADHGYENFSLHPHISKLRISGTLMGVFDSIIESKDDRNTILPTLVECVEAGSRPRGFLTLEDFPGNKSAMPLKFVPPPLIPTFSPEPVFWSRLSDRRCYWSRCTFCVQNEKYDNAKPPFRAEADLALDRIEGLLSAGYRTFIFSDEAVSPAFLRYFSQGIVERKLSFRWACRCKLELSHTGDLFRQIRAAGCYEVLFGLESTAPRVQKLMDKYVDGLDIKRINEIFHSMDASGIGLHINLIGGFPGETVDELNQSVDFLIESFKDLKGATFLLNQFALFPNTFIINNPQVFGIVPIVGSGDMPASYGYHVGTEGSEEACNINQTVDSLRKKLLSALGWNRFGSGPGPESAISLYFGSGHGSIFKTQEINPFANPLCDTTKVNL
jgi:hypothetical protein